MRKQVHVFLVGTSTIRNLPRYDGFNRLSKELKELVLEWGKVTDDPRCTNHLSVSSPIFKLALEYVNEKPREASAELNAFLSLMEVYGISPNVIDKVYLVRTDTYLAALCTLVLREHLRAIIREVEEVVVPGYGRDFEEGLINLMYTIYRICRSERREYDVYLNATGGFKPESAMAVIAAALGGASYVYYIHEAFREVKAIPLMPISLKEEFVRELRSFVDKRYSEVRSEFERTIVRFFFKIEGGKLRPKPLVSELLGLEGS